jgi:predicted secreted hydrolase
MDHQWGDFITLADTGWDWFSVRLDDGSAYMVYAIRDASGAPASVIGTAVRPDGTSVDLLPADITISPTSSWTSPRSGAKYPSGWTLRIASVGLGARLDPILPDQELNTTKTTGMIYWEGAVSVTGTMGGRTVGGRGYVELAGYAKAVAPSVK